MTADSRKGSLAITKQTSYGSGDNIDGNKTVNIYQDIAPKSLLAPIEKILNFVKNKDEHNALLVLDTIKSMGNLDSKSLALLDTVSVRVNLIKQIDIDDAYKTLTDFYKTKPEGIAADLCISSLIRLDVAKGAVDDARERYKQLLAPEVYTQEAYFELLADVAELEAKYKANRLYLTEIDLCSLIRGGLRVDLNDLTINIAEQLVDNFPSFNSSVLLVIAKTNKLGDKLGNYNYWFISYQLKCELELIIQELIPLVEASNGNDERLIPIIASILHYKMGQSEDLHKLCCKYIDKIEKVQPSIAKLIKLNDNDIIDTAETTEDKIFKANKESVYRKELIGEIVSKDIISAGDAAVLATIGDNASVSKWLDNNPQIACDDSYEEEFILLEFKASICCNDPTRKLEYENIFNDFITVHSEPLTNINPIRIQALAGKLMDIDLSTLAIKLLSIFVDKSDPWPSPPVKLYLDALYDSEQYGSLNSILFNINDDACVFHTWQLRAILNAKNGDVPSASIALKKALKLNPSSIECWYNLLGILKEGKANRDELVKTLNEIPPELLNKPSMLSASILNEASFLGLFHKTEEIMLNWFIQDSESNSVIFTNLFTSITTFNKNPLEKIEPRLSLPNGDSAYTYLVDTKESTKIITRADVKASSYVLSHNSPIGRKLLTMYAGQVESVGTQRITLIKQVEPIVAAYQISLKLRHVANDGSDCFDMFETSSDGNELIEQLKSKMQAGNENRVFIATNTVLPLTMKCERLNTAEPVRIALEAMSSPEVIKHPLFDGGLNVDDRIVLDTFSILYLAMTGLYNSSKLNDYYLYVTTATLHCFEQWFESIEDPDYMVAGVNSVGDFYRVLKDDIQEQTKSIQIGINHILDKAEIQKANTVDLPPNLQKIKGLICHSVYSSITLSIANDIPWLCIDGQLAHYYSALGLSSINAQQFIKTLADSTDLEHKKQGIFYNINSGLPYPLTYEEMFQLSKSNEDIDLYFLAELLNKNMNTFQLSDEAVQFSYKLLLPVLHKGYLDGEILRGSRVDNIHNDGLVERIFYACCRMVISPKDGKVAEEKLAHLLVALSFAANKTPDLRSLVFVLFRSFIKGHFLSLDAVIEYSKKITAERVVGNEELVN